MKKTLVKVLYFLIPCFIFFGVLFLLWNITGSQPIGHDEAVYLTKARSWTEATPSDEFKIYRPIGMAAFGWAFLHFGDSEKFVRAFGVIFGAVTVLFVYLLFRRLFNSLVAFGVISIVGSSYLFLKESPLFQNDVPSSGLLIGVLWLLWAYYETAGKSNLIYFFGPLAALAFYLRYGVASAFVVIGVSSLTLLATKFIKKENVDYSKLKIAFIISIFLFIPHFIYSLIEEKSFLGILNRSGKVAGREYIGEGLANYINWLPNEIGGWALGITAIMGIIATIIIAFRNKLRKSHTGLLWIGSIGLFNFVVTGLLVHAEPRYVFFPIVLLSGTGVTSAYYLLRNYSRVSADSFMIIFILISLYYGFLHYQETYSFFKTKEVDRYRVAYVQASEAISSDSSREHGCVVWAITTYRPAVSWYSGCNTLNVTNVMDFEKNFQIHLKKDHYSIVLDKVSEPQINQTEADRFGIILTEIFRTKNLSKASRGDLIVYRITRKNHTEEDFLNLLEK